MGTLAKRFIGDRAFYRRVLAITIPVMVQIGITRIAGSLENGQLLLSVKDDGIGFDPASAPGVADGHFGLQGIRERITRYGGELRVESAPGKGTRAVIRLSAATADAGRENETT